MTTKYINVVRENRVVGKITVEIFGSPDEHELEDFIGEIRSCVEEDKAGDAAPVSV
jgi:hypothetical protein